MLRLRPPEIKPGQSMECNFRYGGMATMFALVLFLSGSCLMVSNNVALPMPEQTFLIIPF